MFLNIVEVPLPHHLTINTCFLEHQPPNRHTHILAFAPLLLTLLLLLFPIHHPIHQITPTPTKQIIGRNSNHNLGVVKKLLNLIPNIIHTNPAKEIEPLELHPSPPHLAAPVHMRGVLQALRNPRS